MTDHIIDHHGQPLYYTESGQGEPVLFVHGFAEDGQIWNGIRTELGNDFRVIVADLPGSGRSGTIGQGTTVEALAEAIKQILDHAGIRRCSVIGHSMGGYILLALTEKYPELVTKLGLFHSTSLPDSEEKKLNRLKNADFIERNGTTKFLLQSVPKLFSLQTNQERPELVEEIIRRYSNFLPKSLVQYTLAMRNRPDRTRVIQTFSGPVLFIIGEFDTAVPPEQSFRECQLPGISYIYAGTHSAHMGMLEEPGFCETAVRYFLSAI